MAVHEFSWRRARAVAAKEFRHILRDPFTIGFAFVMPLLMVVFFGYAIDFNIQNVGVELRDQDRSRASRQLAELLSASGVFTLSAPSPGLSPERVLAAERAKAVLTIQPGFGRTLAQGAPGRVEFALDGADNQTAGTVSAYLGQVQALASRRLAPRGAPAALPGPRLETRFLFNPSLDTHRFIIPGLIVLVTTMLAVMLTALAVAREWESGSMELLLSTPIEPLELVLGKLAPYLALSELAIAVVYVVVRVGFGTAVAGSLPLFFGVIMLYLALCLAQGLLISAITRQQALAMQLALLTGLLPSMLLSGFIFPVESMPAFFQWVTLALPARWCTAFVRAVWLKGAGAAEMAVPILALSGMTVALVGLARMRLKRSLEP